RLLTLAIFRKIPEKLFVLVFACVKAPATAIFTPKQKTQILHEVLWAKGYRVNSLVWNSLYFGAIQIFGHHYQWGQD
ncbi:hypothetical protein, partial [Nostoc commune]|uniref:hypothetical protein n=1 Tax=Nostoc commune TaxID=1178 RepID=UPI001E52925D